jgi:hypothetical protein
MRPRLSALVAGLLVLAAAPQNALAWHKGDPGIPHGNQTTCDGPPPPDQKIVFVTSDAYLADIAQITPKFVEIVPPYHRQGNCIPSAAIRWPDFGDRPSFERPFALIFHHSDTPLLAFSPDRRFPRPTPERVLAADHQSGSGFSGTVPSAPPLRPVGT